MDLAATLRAALKALLLPPTSLIVVGLVAIALLRSRPVLARALLVVSWVTLYALSLQPVADALQLAAGSNRAIDAEQLKSAQAIVVLGGGLRTDAAEYGSDTLGRLTLERIRYAARLARLSALPLLVTGGRPPYASRAEGDVMREALEQEFGLSVRWTETSSRNTRENARFSAALLEPHGIRRVALVMHGFDVDRAVAEFRDAGLEPIAAPTLLPQPGIGSVADLLPQPGALLGSYYALYELGGRLVRRMGLR